MPLWIDVGLYLDAQHSKEIHDIIKLTFKRRIKPNLSSAGIIRSSPYSPRFQDKG